MLCTLPELVRGLLQGLEVVGNDEEEDDTSGKKNKGCEWYLKKSLQQL